MIKIKQATSKGYIEMCDGGVFDANYPNSKTRRGRVQGGGTISPTITAQNSEVYRVEVIAVDEQNMNFRYETFGTLTTDGSSPKHNNRVMEVNMEKQYRIRKLTPRECGRLMCVSDDDITKMMNVNSNSQCYKQFGNSIVVDVLAAMFSQLGITGVDKWNDIH